MTPMPQEARLINRLFRQHKVPGGVLPPPASYQTAPLRLYHLQQETGVPVSKVTGLADELDEALTNLRRYPCRCALSDCPCAWRCHGPIHGHCACTGCWSACRRNSLRRDVWWR